MKYRIILKSDIYGKKQPCKDAYKVREVSNDGVQWWGIELHNLEDIDKLIKETNHAVMFCPAFIVIWDTVEI